MLIEVGAAWVISGVTIEGVEIGTVVVMAGNPTHVDMLRDRIGQHADVDALRAEAERSRAALQNSDEQWAKAVRERDAMAARLGAEREAGARELAERIAPAFAAISVLMGFASLGDAAAILSRYPPAVEPAGLSVPDDGEGA